MRQLIEWVHAQVPMLETPEGGIFESNAIARYVARLKENGLFGASAFEAVRARRATCPPHAALPRRRASEQPPVP